MGDNYDPLACHLHNLQEKCLPMGPGLPDASKGIRRGQSLEGWHEYVLGQMKTEEYS